MKLYVYGYLNRVQSSRRLERGRAQHRTYEGRSTSGKRFRNSEILTVQDGKIVDVEVYFGWVIPHEAAEGGFVNPEKH